MKSQPLHTHVLLYVTKYNRSFSPAKWESSKDVSWQREDT